MEYIIHPLVFLNISDHFTLTAANNRLKENKLILGCLMGTHVGRRTEIFTSFEILEEGGKIDGELLSRRADQIHECYQNYNVLGWYMVKANKDIDIINLNNKITEYTNCKQICLIFDRSQKQEEKQFTLYDIVVCLFF